MDRMQSSKILVALTHHRTKGQYAKLALHSLSRCAKLGERFNVVLFDDVKGGDPTRSARAAGKGLFDHCMAVYEGKWGGVNHVWNYILACESSDPYDYIIFSNDDVLFTPGSIREMVNAFDEPDCGISGPMTNAPGHAPWQKPEGCPADFGDILQVLPELKAENQYTEVPYLNGFCFCLRVSQARSMGPFSTDHPNYGGEDEYQKRLHAEGLKSILAGHAFVFHFKDASQRSADSGRIETIGLPPLLKAEGVPA